MNFVYRTLILGAQLYIEVTPGGQPLDLNDFTTCGNYFVRDSYVVNAPHTSWGFLWVLRSSGYIAQFWMPDNETSLYYRRGSIANWLSGWVTIYKSA